MRPALWTLAVVSGIFCLLFLLERALPLRRQHRPLLGRLFINLAISALAFVVAAILVHPTAVGALNWSNQQPFGLVYLFNLPSAAKFIVSFLLLDLMFYWWHVANHRIPFLWRFHNVHHIDPDLDVSTGFRFHFGEVAMLLHFALSRSWRLGSPHPRSLRTKSCFRPTRFFITATSGRRSGSNDS